MLTTTLFVLTGCEEENDHHKNNYGDRDQQKPEIGEESSKDDSTYNDNHDVDTNTPSQEEATITLVNHSSVTIYFTVNGDPRSVTPGKTEIWQYQGVAKLSSIISGNPWSYTWHDGQNHSYVATDNGISGGFDLN
jgi:hypothetical protein